MKFVFIFIILAFLCASIMAQEYTADYWLQKGDEFYINNSYGLALRCYEKAIEINPKDAYAWNNKGNFLKELGHATEADAAFAKAIELGYENTTLIDVTPIETSEGISIINESTPANITPVDIKSETSIIFNSIVLLFDASNSMSGNKMSNAKSLTQNKIDNFIL
jgi:tetratricopeptide (TPR) repeat protein